MTEPVSLRDAWELRNAAAATLVRAEKQMQHLLQAADAGEVVRLLEAFSPGRSPGPEWTRSFEPLLERLWLWCSAETIAAVEADFRERGPAWGAVANALLPEHGAQLRALLRPHSAQSRLPALTIE